MTPDIIMKLTDTHKGVIIIGLALSFLPIWRQGPHNRVTGGLNLWQLLSYLNQFGFDAEFGHPHITYEEAVARAREAYHG